MTTTTKDTERSESQAIAQMESIAGMIRTMRDAVEKNDDNAREEAEQAIHEDPLEVSVRSEWVSPGESLTAREYLILLCTGGSAVRIVGDLNRYGEPTSAKLEHQDWGTPWTTYHQADEEILLEYARCFYFGF